MKLKNRIAVVTGGSSGIGRGICLEFAREGAAIVVADIEQTPKRGRYFATDTLPPTVEEIERLGSEGAFVQTDVADQDSVHRLIDSTVARFGGLDILVNNAGINIHGTSQEVSVADWDRVIAVDLIPSHRDAAVYVRPGSQGVGSRLRGNDGFTARSKRNGIRGRRRPWSRSARWS